MYTLEYLSFSGGKIIFGLPFSTITSAPNDSNNPRITSFLYIFSSEAFKQLSIFPLNGKIACVSVLPLRIEERLDFPSQIHKRNFFFQLVYFFLL